MAYSAIFIIVVIIVIGIIIIIVVIIIMHKQQTRIDVLAICCSFINGGFVASRVETTNTFETLWCEAQPSCRGMS